MWTHHFKHCVARLGLLSLALFLSGCALSTPSTPRSNPTRSFHTMTSTPILNTLPTKFSTQTSPSNLVACVTAQSLWVRSGPGIGFDKLGYLRNAECVDIDARNNVGSWVRITSLWVQRMHGWVSVSYLEIDGEVSTLPISGPDPTPTPSRTPRPSPTSTRWPTTTRKPSKPPSSGGGNCHPSYQGACLLVGISDYDCGCGSGNGPNYVYIRVKVVGYDEFGLDRDRDGWGCECYP